MAAFAHPVQLRIVDVMLEQPGKTWSPTQLTDALGDVPLPNVSYHVRKLVERGVLELAGREIVRGAVLHLYGLERGLR